MKALIISVFAMGLAFTASAQQATTTPAPSDVKQVKTKPTMRANTPISPAAKKTGAATSEVGTEKTPQATTTNKRVEQPTGNNNTPQKAVSGKNDPSGITVSPKNATPQGGQTKSTETLQQASPAPAVAKPRN